MLKIIQQLANQRECLPVTSNCQALRVGVLGRLKTIDKVCSIHYGDKQNYPFCRIQFLVEKFEHSMNKPWGLSLNFDWMFH